MANLINNSSRTLGVYGAHSKTINLMPGKATPVSGKDLEAITANSTARAWIMAGTIIVDDEAPKRPASPAPKEDGPEVRHIGAGRYGVFVGGEKLSDEPMTKEDAQAMADEYAGS